MKLTWKIFDFKIISGHHTGLECFVQGLKIFVKNLRGAKVVSKNLRGLKIFLAFPKFSLIFLGFLRGGL